MQKGSCCPWPVNEYYQILPIIADCKTFLGNKCKYHKKDICRRMCMTDVRCQAALFRPDSDSCVKYNR